MERLRGTEEVTNEVLEDIVHVIKGTKEKFILYMAHKCRVQCQKIAINKKILELQEVCCSSNRKEVKGILILDFKMKFNPISGRETTLDHYGKRGIGWHGCQLTYYRQMVIDDETKMVRHIVYFDQILEGSNKQDGSCAFSMLELVLIAIMDELPFITEIGLQSDNANCYQNKFVTFGIALLNLKYHRKMYIKYFIHTETQDGKSSLDAHFACAMRFLSCFMRTWYKNRITRINTARGLAFALSAKGGQTNTVVQLVDISRSRLKEVFSGLEKGMDKVKDYFARANEIEYERPSDEDAARNWTNLETISGLNFNMTVRSYGRIGNGVKFFIDLRINRNSVSIDAQSQQEIDNYLAGNISMTQQEEEMDQIVALPTHPTNAEEDFGYERVQQNPGNSNEQNPESSEDSDWDDSDNDSDSSTDDETALRNLVDMRRYLEPDNTVYNANDMITQSVVTRVLELGNVKLSKESLGNQEVQTRTRFALKRTNERKDILAIVVRHAKSFMASSFSITDKMDLDADYSKAENFIPEFKPTQGWARRGARGTLYGNSYIGKYKDTISSMFEDGKKDSSKKMNAAMMREKLCQLHPDVFSIPGETTIKKEISALFQKSKSSASNNEEREGGTHTTRQHIWTASEKAREHLELLTEIVSDNMKGAPRDLLQTFMSQVRPEDIASLPSKEQIEQKISSLKTSFQKKAMASVV